MDAADIPPDVRAVARRRLRGLDHTEDDPARRVRAAYYAEHRDRALAASKRWKQQNPERAREINRESMRRTLQARRRVQARRAWGRAWYAAHRDSERERARRFREQNPGKVHLYKQRFRERHPERLAEQSRRATRAWRDRNAARQRDVDRESAAQRRRSDPDLNRRYYRNNLEKERLRSRTAARQRRRIEALGLPPRRIHHVFAEEKRANVAAAEEFFARRRKAPEIRDLLLERDAAPYARLARAEARRAARGLPASPDAAKLRADIAAEMDKKLWSKVLPSIVIEFADRNRDRIAEEIRMDSVARRLAGKPPYIPADELAKRMTAAVFEHAAKQLIPDGDAERLRRLASVMFAPTKRSTPSESGVELTRQIAPFILQRTGGLGR